MTISRRTFSTMAAVAAVATTSQSASAQSADEKALSATIEDLRLGLMNKDKAKLEAVSDINLSYGHSAGVIENRQQFIDAVMARKAVVKALAFTEPRNAIHGNTAIARHFYESTSEVDGKENSIKVGVLQVWQKQDGKWKLYARQAHILPAPPKT